MTQKFISKAIVDFLKAKREDHPGQDLLDRYLKYGTNCETQVNVAAGDGEPVHGKRATWTDGINEWWNLRIPKNAMDEPEFKDYKLKWPLELHADGIGSTGWDWKARCSRWLGFDFDALTGHAKGVGINEDALKEVQRQAEELPYVEVRKSTGGKGIHLYVYVDEIPTQNHTEHAALARCILGMMSSETMFDFAGQLDCCGGVMWLWHRKLTPENQGLALVKPAEKILGVNDLPSNWKDHIEVVSGKRGKIKVSGVKDEYVDPFDKLASARRIIDLDDTHKAIIDELTRSGYSTVWISDHHLLQTHTCALQKIMEDPDIYKELGLKGFYSTTSEGSDRASPNCFMFPLPKGAWKVYRFSPGVSEANTWLQDGETWTTCYFNHEPDLKTAARALGGAEIADNKGFQFESAKDAIKVAEALGEKIKIEDKLKYREAVVRPNKDGRLVIRVEKQKDEARPSGGWAKVGAGGKFWEKVFELKTDPTEDALGADEFDDNLRTLVTPKGDSAGWFIKTSQNHWTRRPQGECKNWLQNRGLTRQDAEVILGGCVDKPWTLVHLPFNKEEPGGRRWNYNAPQFKFKPANIKEDEAPHHPHWDKILNHCFCDLDEEIKKLSWCQEANIRNGYQYGLTWIACCFRAPFEPLPFLFFFGNQECGKSIFHEALSLLITTGVVDAKMALTNKSAFNGELEGGVLAVIEEEDISGSAHAYNRMKEWVTAKTLSIRKMRTDAYPVPNTLHFCMFANNQGYCPVLPGDSRIMVIEVRDLMEGEEIPKEELLERLKEEAPHFMRTLMNVELPTVKNRMSVKVVDTYKRQQSQEFARSPLETFINGVCHYAPGEKILFSEFYDRFTDSLDAEDRYEWSKQKVSKGLPSDTPCGSSGGKSQRYIGNLSWEPAKDPDAEAYICVNSRLKLKG
jgi:hypothetical protein